MSTWVFLRGLMRESRHWGDFPAVFSGEIAGANVLTLDLPGNGRLHHMPSPMRVEQMAAYCHRDVLERGLTPPYHLLGLSLGAMVAVAWSTHHPEEIGGCVLINTSLRPFSPFYQRLRPRNYLDLFRAALIAGDAEQQERLILRLTSCRGDTQLNILNAWAAYRRQCPVSRNNTLRQLLAAARYRAPAHKPDPSLLVLASSGDQLVDPRCSQRLVSQWQTTLAMHPSAGHDLPLDDGLWVARQVRDWLVRCNMHSPHSSRPA